MGDHYHTGMPEDGREVFRITHQQEILPGKPRDSRCQRHVETHQFRDRGRQVGEIVYARAPLTGVCLVDTHGVAGTLQESVEVVEVGFCSSYDGDILVCDDADFQDGSPQVIMPYR